MTRIVWFVAAAAVLVALGVPVQAQTPEIEAQRARAEAGDIVAQFSLMSAGLGPEVVVRLIEKSGGAFRVDVASLVELAQAEVPDPFVNAMLEAVEAERSPTVATFRSSLRWRVGQSASAVGCSNGVEL